MLVGITWGGRRLAGRVQDHRAHKLSPGQVDETGGAAGGGKGIGQGRPGFPHRAGGKVWGRRGKSGHCSEWTLF